MAARHPLFVANGTAGVTTPQDARLALASLLTGPGILNGFSVSGSSSGPNMKYLVTAGAVATQRGTLSADGLYLWTNDGTFTADSGAPAPASGSRYDVIYALARNANDGFGDANSDPIIGVQVGTASSTPSVPAVPTGALVLAQSLVASGSANAAAGTVTITNVAARTLVGTGVATGWVACSGGNVNVSGTSFVKREGNQVFGKFSLTCTGGWPTSQITAFALPDLSFAPGATHRMNVGGAPQATTSIMIMTANPGSTSVFVGANGTATNVSLSWNGPLWRTD